MIWWLRLGRYYIQHDLCSDSENVKHFLTTNFNSVRLSLQGSISFYALILEWLICKRSEFIRQHTPSALISLLEAEL